MLLEKEHLEIMAAASTGMYRGASCYSSERELYLAAKQKLRELMLQRFAGKDDGFSWKRGDEKYVLFSSPQRGDRAENPDGWEVDGMWAMIEDANQISLVDDMETNILLESIINFTGIFETSIQCTIPGRDELEPRQYRAVIEEHIRGYLEDMCSLEEEMLDEYSSRLSGLIFAFDRAGDGFIEEAMEDPAFSELINELNANMGDLYDYAYVVQCLPLFLAPYAWSSPDNDISVTAFQSEEIYWYGKYRDRLPAKTREAIDIAVSIFDTPIVNADVTIEVADFDRSCRHIVTVLVEEACEVTLEDIRPFWKDARDFLMEVLPELREGYLLPGSQSESRVSFLLSRGIMLQHCCAYCVLWHYAAVVLSCVLRGQKKPAEELYGSLAILLGIFDNTHI